MGNDPPPKLDFFKYSNESNLARSETLFILYGVLKSTATPDNI